MPPCHVGCAHERLSRRPRTALSQSATIVRMSRKALVKTTLATTPVRPDGAGSFEISSSTATVTPAARGCRTDDPWLRRPIRYPEPRACGNSGDGRRCSCKTSYTRRCSESDARRGVVIEKHAIMVRVASPHATAAGPLGVVCSLIVEDLHRQEARRLAFVRQKSAGGTLRAVLGV